MDLSDFNLSLRWPKDLFLWESKRISALKSSSLFANMVECLFAEALVEADFAAYLDGVANRALNSGASTRQEAEKAAQVLDAAVQNPRALQQYEPPQYWLERQNGSATITHYKTLVVAFVELVDELSEVGYFPKLLPKPCVDDIDLSEPNPTSEISQAIHAEISWPLDDSIFPIPEDVLFSVIEYFHDQAQRPRTRTFHSYSECGWHYDNHNSESGGVVYRWYINELLDTYGIGFHLGSQGPEKGRLIRHASLQLDGLAAELVKSTSDTADSIVASAIQLYRARASKVHDRRAAVAQLAGFLEKHRKQFKAQEMTKGDESDLFHIFNNFALRHGNATQKGDYGDEYLDWVYWTTLSAIRLLKQLQDRE